MFINKAFPRISVQRGTADHPFDPCITVQDEKDNCDVNKIVARFQRNEVISHVAKYEPQYGDFRGDDYKSAMDTITRANTMFAELPSSARNRFNNDPAAFLDFVQKEENIAEMENMGLTTAPKATFEKPAPVSTDEPAPAVAQSTTPPSAE